MFTVNESLFMLQKYLLNVVVAIKNNWSCHWDKGNFCNICTMTIFVMLIQNVQIAKLPVVKPRIFILVGWCHHIFVFCNKADKYVVNGYKIR